MKILKQSFFLVFLSILLLNFQCDEEDCCVNPNLCNEVLIINDDEYTNDASSSHTIESAIITDDCLEITISSSGCSADSWIMNMYASTAIAESLPEQRYIRFDLENNEECLAQFTRTISFDLTPLRINNNGTLIINLKNWEGNLEYNY